VPLYRWRRPRLSTWYASTDAVAAEAGSAPTGRMRKTPWSFVIAEAGARASRPRATERRSRTRAPLRMRARRLRREARPRLAASGPDRLKGDRREGGRHDRGRPSVRDPAESRPKQTPRREQRRRAPARTGHSGKAAGSDLHAGSARCSLPLVARRGGAVSSAPRLLQASCPRGQGVRTGSPPSHSRDMRCGRAERARVHIADRRRARPRGGEGPGAPPSRPIAGTTGDPGAHPPAISVASSLARSSSGRVVASVRADEAACEVAG